LVWRPPFAEYRRERD